MIHHEDDAVTLHHGDCLDVLRTLPDCSVDAVVCDPPYGLANTTPAQVAETITAWVSGDRSYIPTGRGFMGRSWDAFVPPVAVWDECLRVLKPGGHALVFAGSRTHDLMTLGLRLAGFDIRDTISWLYGSGFPKSLDIGKAIDKAAGATREVVGQHPYITPRKQSPQSWGGTYRWGEEHLAWDDLPGEARSYYSDAGARKGQITAPATPAAQQWQGWGSALKPSHEPVVCARKPLDDRGMLVEIGSHLDRLEQECRRTASDVESDSAPTRPGSHVETTSSVPTSAATPVAGGRELRIPTGGVAGSFDQTATYSCESTGAACLSTVTSWRACWVELCELTSTSTTATTSGTTTDLGTLSSSLSRITGESMAASLSRGPGAPSLVAAADSLFAATVLSSRATLALSATESATNGRRPTSPDAAGPRSEPIVVARKPLGGTLAANVLQWGTGGLNIDATRVGTSGGTSRGANGSNAGKARNTLHGGNFGIEQLDAGRWPTNVVLDDTAAEALDAESGTLKSGSRKAGEHGLMGYMGADVAPMPEVVGDSGGASRFFPVFKYQAKAPTRERPSYIDANGVKQAHSTVKPLELMRWLCRLVTPPGGTILEPFAGSGTTVEAAVLEGFRCIAVEREADYLPLIMARLERARPAPLASDASEDDLTLFGEEIA